MIGLEPNLFAMLFGVHFFEKGRLLYDRSHGRRLVIRLPQVRRLSRILQVSLPVNNLEFRIASFDFDFPKDRPRSGYFVV